MTHDLFLFSWLVQPGAYCWRPAPAPSTAEEGPAKAGDDLWAGQPDVSPASPARQYHPLREYTGLFQIFATTPPNPEGVRAFADRFGMLLDARPSVASVRTKRRKGRRTRVTLAEHSEPFHMWRTEILQMREAVRLWRMLEEADREGLGSHVRCQRRSARGASVEYDSHPQLPAGVEPPPPDGRTKLVVPLDQPAGSRLPDPGDPSLAVRILQDLIAPRLVDGVRPTVTLEPGLNGAIRIGLMPVHLLAGLWLQFAFAVSEHKEYRRCPVCQCEFEVSPGVARTNRRFCSIACKNASFRGRQGQARRMHAEGKTPRQIAQELGADVTTIEGWLGAGG